MDRKFLRLLEAYETLTRDETVALRERNTPALDEIRSKKSAVFPALRDRAAFLRITCGHPQFARSIAALIGMEKSNLEIVRDFLEKARGVRAQIDAAAKQVKNFGNAYARRQTAPAFSAQV
jgi:uncharacterized membrane protein